MPVVHEVTIKLLVEDDGWIHCSPEVAKLVMQAADGLFSQAIHTAKQEEAEKPRIILPN